MPNRYTIELDGRRYVLEGDHAPSEAEARAAIAPDTANPASPEDPIVSAKTGQPTAARAENLPERLLASGQQQRAMTLGTLGSLATLGAGSVGSVAPAVGRLVSNTRAAMPALEWNPTLAAATTYVPATAKALWAGAKALPGAGGVLRAAGQSWRTFLAERPTAVAARTAAAEAEQAAKLATAARIAREGAGPLETQTNLILSPQALAQETNRQAILKILGSRQGTGYAARGALAE